MFSVIKGIVIGRYDYEVEGATGKTSEITVIRLSELATLLTNRHDNTKQMVKQNAGVTQRQSNRLLTGKSRFRNSPPVPNNFGSCSQRRTVNPLP